MGELLKLKTSERNNMYNYKENKNKFIT